MNDELEQIAEAATKAASNGGGKVVVVRTPQGQSTRHLRDRLQRYFTRWHKKLGLHVEQNVKLNLVAIAKHGSAVVRSA